MNNNLSYGLGSRMYSILHNMIVPVGKGYFEGKKKVFSICML